MEGTASGAEETRYRISLEWRKQDTGLVCSGGDKIQDLSGVEKTRYRISLERRRPDTGLVWRGGTIYRILNEIN